MMPRKKGFEHHWFLYSPRNCSAQVQVNSRNPCIQKCLVLHKSRKPCSGLLAAGLEFSILFQMELPGPQGKGHHFPATSPPAASAPLYFRQSPPPVPPNTHSQWAPVCSEHPSLAPRSWSGPSFSILPALLRASENLEAAALGKAVAVTVVRLQQPGQSEPMREKPPKRINTLLHQALSSAKPPGKCYLYFFQ